MRPFDDFRASIEPLTNKIKHGQQLATSAMNDAGCSLLRDIFCSIRIMASGTSLVGNSKVMHHMLPNIVPPIDREYTLRFLYGNTTIANDVEREWQTMREIISAFFIPVACNPSFATQAEGWIADAPKHPWDTSVMKVIDNLLIGSRKYAAGST